MDTRLSPASPRTSPARRCPVLLACLGAGLALASGCEHAPPNVTVLPGDTVLDTTKFVGEGRLSHAAEFVELDIQVTSECYATPLEAAKATDAAVARIMTLLEAKIDASNDKDGVFSHGGYTAPFSRYDSSTGRHTCVGTFQKTSSVVLKTSKLDSFAQDFSEIQGIVFETMREPQEGEPERGVTFASTGTPQPQLYYETRERLEREALADALVNARDKFEATAAAACKDPKFRVHRFVELSADGGRPIAYGGAPHRGAEGGAVGFDAIWINKVLDVFFVIESECRESRGG